MKLVVCNQASPDCLCTHKEPHVEHDSCTEITICAIGEPVRCIVCEEIEVREYENYD